MNSFEELRYPWSNALEFLSGSYWAELAAIHLTLGWIFIGWLLLRVNINSKLPAEFRLSVLYFSLTVFTNPAFNMLGLNVNEIFGLLALFVFFLKGHIPNGRNVSQVVASLFLVFLISFLHVLLGVFIYPDLLPDANSVITKLAINCKIAVLAVNLLIVGISLRRGVGLNALMQLCLMSATFGLWMYLVQILVALFGTLPYGTYLDAGFAGVPSFGSVSIERGHFGKFMASYFPFFLFALIVWRSYFLFYLYCVVSIVNISASSQVFFVFSLVLAAGIFRRDISYRHFAFIVAGLIASFVLIVLNWAVFEGVVEKIIRIAVKGDETDGGGRSVGTLLAYLQAYPLGIGFSGSTLRTAPGLAEINSGFFAFISQYSFLSPFVVLGYMFLMFRTARRGLKGGSLERCFVVGVLLSPLIFFVEILWFMPMIWLCFEIIHSQTRTDRLRVGFEKREARSLSKVNLC